jgi:hypothetical protein
VCRAVCCRAYHREGVPTSTPVNALSPCDISDLSGEFSRVEYSLFLVTSRRHSQCPVGSPGHCSGQPLCRADRSDLQVAAHQEHAPRPPHADSTFEGNTQRPAGGPATIHRREWKCLAGTFRHRRPRFQACGKGQNWVSGQQDRRVLGVKLLERTRNSLTPTCSAEI